MDLKKACGESLAGILAPVRSISVNNQHILDDRRWICREKEKNIDNKLDRFDQRLEEMGVRIRDADQLKVREDVFDDITLLRSTNSCIRNGFPLSADP